MIQMSFFSQMNLLGDPNIGLYGFATDSYCLLGVKEEKINKTVNDILKVPVYNFRFLDMNLIKLLAAGNSSGVVLSSIIDRDDINHFTDKFEFESKVLKTSHAIGNFILMNDKGIVISPEIRKLKDDIEKFFSLDSVVCTIAGLNIVGTLGVANNKGCMVHPDVKEREVSLIKKSLDVEINIGTVNFGNPYPGSGVIVNNSGFLASRRTSGPELGRITESLGFLE